MNVDDIMHAIEDGCDGKCDDCTVDIFKSTNSRGGQLCNMLRDENVRKGIWGPIRNKTMIDGDSGCDLK